MRVVRPHTPRTGPGRTLTTALKALRPSRVDLVDAGLLLALAMIALLGFATTFEGWRYLLVGGIGLLLGIAWAHLGTALRWHWLVPTAAAVTTYFLVGPALAAGPDALGGVLPTVAALRRLMGLAIGGWKEVLTTLPPLDGASEYVALPFLLSLVVGVLGFSVARRVKAGSPALIAPGLLFVLVLALGTLLPGALLVQGLGFAVVAFLWLMLRNRRRRQLVGTGRTHRIQVLLGAGVLALAMLAGAFLGPAVLGATPRQVIRSYVQPPLEIDRYPTPLVGFRTFSSKALNLAYEQPLLQVTGLAAGARLRLSVMDAYTGASWSAAGAGDGDTGFQRLGAQVPNPPLTGVQQVSIEVLPAFAADNNLNLWLPSLGRTASVTFQGTNARQHASVFRYKLASQQGLVQDRLKAGDVVDTAGAPLPVFDPATESFDPGSGALLGDAATSFLGPTGQKMAGPSNVPLDRIKAIAEELRGGAWSDGTKPGEQHFLPGHGIFRLNRMVKAPQLVGSDEQYASLFALLANAAGYPSRVVFGAIVPEGGRVQGKDIHAWVELQGSDGQWVTVPDSVFTPDRTKTPKQTTNIPEDQKAATKVPPPNPVRPPASTDEMNESQPSAARVEPTTEDTFLQTLLQILAWVGPPVGALALLVSLIIGAKALRRRRRRTRGALSTRVVGGWQEILDQARDLGRPVPPNQTRLQQSHALGGGVLTELAATANKTIFGRGDVLPEQVSGYWKDVDSARRSMLKGSGFWAALRGRLSLASLVSRTEPRARSKRPRPGKR